MPQLGIQPWTVRDVMQSDFLGTVKKIRSIGYDGIEGGSPGPLSPADYGKLLKDIGLQNPGAHTGFKAIEEDWAKTSAFFKSIGVKFLALSDGPETADACKKLGDRLTAAGRKVTADGFVFQYHNHAREFRKYDGKFGMEIIMETADPACVLFQVDVGWVRNAGEDPVTWLKKYKGRIRTIHMKDTTPPPDPKWTEVGTGCVDFKAVHAECKAQGVEWYMVEQDTCARPTLESAEISHGAARKILAG